MLDPDEQQNVTQLLVYLLPACNSDTLHRLLEFLSTVTDHAHDRLNKDGQEVSRKYASKKVDHHRTVDTKKPHKDLSAEEVLAHSKNVPKNK